MNLIRLGLLNLLVLLFVSCGTTSKVTIVDNETGYFPTRKNRKATITTSIKVDPDTIKNLVVVNNSEYLRSMALNMKYFKKVMNFIELEKDINNEGFEVKAPLNLGALDNYTEYIHGNPCTVLYMESRKKGNKWYAELKLYDPLRGEDIFISEIFLNMMLDGWTDQGTSYPLFNSLIDYLHGLE